jgi:hypothetical protein
VPNRLSNSAACVMRARHAAPLPSFPRKPESSPTAGGISIPRDAGLLDPGASPGRPSGVCRGDYHACGLTDAILLKSATLGMEAGTRLIHDLEREYQSDRMMGRIGAFG